MTTPLHDYSSLGLPRITRTHTFQLRLLAACCRFFLDFFDHTTQARYDGARGFSSTYFLALLLLLLLFPWGELLFHSFFFRLGQIRTTDTIPLAAGKAAFFVSHLNFQALITGAAQLS